MISRGVLLVGDSWPVFMQAYRSLELMFEDNGLGQYGQRGYDTTLVGVAASEYKTSDFIQKLTDELNNYPTIDIVHFSLGGNDFVLYSDWGPDSTEQETQEIFDTVNADIEYVVDYILSIRPNIRVCMCGYTFANHIKNGAPIPLQNQVWSDYEALPPGHGPTQRSRLLRA